MTTPLINAAGLGKAFGVRTLFEGIDLVIAEGDRVGVIGPNGAGKSTLLQILAGTQDADEGTVIRRRGLRVAFVPQEEALDPEASIFSIVLRAAAESTDTSDVETEVEREVRVRIVLDQAGFDNPDRPTGELSGGWRKRVAIAAALARQPDVVLLDEPTNHLDLDGILWLEKLLTASRFAYAVISHDRAFLQQVARRMIEVSPSYPGGLLSVTGDYRRFLEERAAYLESRARYREGLANRVRRELEWLGRGPKARTTKAQARIDQAERMQEELAELDRQRPADPVGVDFESSGRRTKRLLKATGLGASVEGRQLFDGLDLLLSPGRRVGVVGPNGCGKTTLLRILAGEREAEKGTLRTAEHLRVVYFDQAREHLDVEQPLRRALAGPSDAVVYRDREIHVVTWAHRFGFRTDQLDLAVRELSGGERARIHIARMMLRPADLLILDEPTNDLDILTLEVLEESLLDFPGAVVLVTHDRMLLDTVCTTLIGLDGRGGVTSFADSDQWLESRVVPDTPRPAPKRAERPRTAKKRGLSYLEKREYEGMEAAILEAEAELEAVNARLEDPAVQTDAQAVHEAFEAQRAAQERVDGLYARWADLEAKLGS
jgi:ATP-binding cassette subfamily F protein uup